MGYIDEIKNFLLNDNIRVSHKAAIIVFVMASFLVVDNILGFSYYFNIDRKLEHLEKLDKIINDNKSDSTTVSFAKISKYNMLSRNNCLDYFSDFTINMYSIIKKKVPTIQTDNTKDVNIDFDFWFHLTSGGFFYILAIIMSPVILMSNPNIPIIQRCATSILAFSMLFLFGFVFYKICSLIPHIDSKIFTYFVNLFLQVTAVTIMTKLIQNNTK
jgi:hypothetical protein